MRWITNRIKSDPDQALVHYSCIIVKNIRFMMMVLIIVIIIKVHFEASYLHGRMQHEDNIMTL